MEANLTLGNGTNANYFDIISELVFVVSCGSARLAPPISFLCPLGDSRLCRPTLQTVRSLCSPAQSEIPLQDHVYRQPDSPLLIFRVVSPV